MVIEKNHRANRYFYTPPVIEYEVEDDMRRLFYDSHPFELSRPRVLLETEDKISDKVEDENIHDNEVSGER